MAAIEVYNHKHYSRIDRHLTNTYFVNYIVSQMTLNEEPAANKREAKKIRKQALKVKESRQRKGSQ